MLSKEQIMKLIPKNKQEGIYDAWEDSDGIWITLKDGWNADNMDRNCGVIHEGGEGDEEPRSEVMKHLKFQINGIRKKQMTAKEIRALTGLSRAKFCEMYGIPVRSMENWENGTTKAPDYVLALLESAVKSDFK